MYNSNIFIIFVAKIRKIYCIINNKNTFLEKELPYESLKKIGIDKNSILSMPKELIEPLLSGKVSPLLRTTIATNDGRNIVMPMKLQLSRRENGEVKVLAYPVRREVLNDMKMNSSQMDHLKRGDIVLKEFTENNSKRKYFVQLDNETNSLIKKSVSKIRMQDKLANFEKINNIELGINQKKAALEGKPIELTVGDKKMSVGVDLKEPQGFKIVQGDFKE